MKRFFSYFFAIIIITAAFAGGLWYYSNAYRSHSYTINAPIPDFLMLSKNNQVTLLDFWSPVVEKTHGDSGDLPDLTAQSVLMYDLTDNKILYQKDPNIKRPMASLTKIMTAIIALESPKPDDRYVVTQSDVVTGDAMGISPGEVYSLEDLLYGLILHSGNDAAETLANNYPGGRSAFVSAMNNKAKALGMLSTNYTNPSGLEGDGNQYTTTYNLLIATRYALDRYPFFTKVVSSATYTIPASSEHKEIDLSNETNLLTTYPGVEGVKTGYTPEAGLCLVTYLDYGGHRIVGVILNSQDRRNEMKKLLDYSLKSVDVTPPPVQDE